MSWLWLLSCVARSSTPEAELVAVIVGPNGPREARPIDGVLTLQPEPAAVQVRIAEQGRARAVATRMLGDGAAAVRVTWSSGSAGGDTWIAEDRPEHLAGVPVRFGGANAAGIAIRKNRSFELCDPRGCAPLEPGRPTVSGALTLTLEDWLPTSEARTVGVPDPAGAPAARVEVLAPAGARSEWLLVGDPTSHLTLGNARLWVRG